VPEDPYNLPASIDRVAQPQIQDGNPEVNISESLVRIPGLVVHNRQNYAQDLQISSRGFGARATFGVRGVRLIADGIPLTMPDGQGQAGSIDLSSVEHIEVLRGPFSALYGNASGGVIQVFTEDGPPQPTVTPSLEWGSYGAQRQGLKFGGQAGRLNYLADATRFETQGYRSHSEATRNTINDKLKVDLTDASSLTLIVNALDQPDTKDPMGLTRAQVDANPRQATSVADTFNTRKNIDHEQAGAVYEQRLDSDDTLRLMGYGGHRGILQFQAIPISAQAPASSPGGVVDVDRAFSGLDARWTRKATLLNKPLTAILGVNYDNMIDRRRGFNDFIGAETGVQGSLRRDEQDLAQSAGEYLQATWEPHPRWEIDGGLRGTQVFFHSSDYYIVPGNGDDSGSTQFTKVTPAGGVLFKAAPFLHLYANAGEGFETPTFDELAYQANGAAGLNLALQPAESTHYEIGAKARITDRTHVNAALFHIDTRHEIVVNTNSGGRSTYQNAGKTQREGAEFLVDSDLGAGFGTYASFSYLDAHFTDTFTECTGTPCVNVAVPSGNKLPGVPSSLVYGELSWRHEVSGFSTAVEALRSEKIYVNDANSESADAYAVFNWRAVLERKFGHWSAKTFVRVDNIADKNYVGSVIVADSNGRFYEPSPGRNYTGGISASYSF